MYYLDFETRSKVDLSKAGAVVYSQHPSTEILCLAIAHNNSSILGFVDLQDPELKKFLTRAINSGDLFEAHNAFFEFHIFNNILAPLLNLKKLPIERWRCSAALAAANGLPRSLGAAALVLGLDAQKDNDGRRLMLKMSKPRPPSKKNKDIWYDSLELRQQLLEYCIKDVAAERALSENLKPLNPTEQKVWLLDFKINNLGVFVDSEAISSALTLVEKRVEVLNSEVYKLTGGALDGVSKIDKCKTWCAEQGFELDSFRAEYLKSILEDEIPSKVRRLVEIRLELGKTSTSKFSAFQSMLSCVDSRSRGLLRYHGAHTGRWSGNGVQPQNLPRGLPVDVDVLIDIIKEKDLDLLSMLYENPMSAISSSIRGVICASGGKKLVGADYSSIEPRVLLWLARDEKGLDLFRNKQDLYVDMAASIFNIPIFKVTKDQRRLGKVAILGLGYGMGYKRFYETCIQDNIDIDENMAIRIVEAYRKKYSSVTALWRALESAVKHTISTGETTLVKSVTFSLSSDKKFLHCTLPSKRMIVYVHPEIKREPGKSNENIYFSRVDPKTFKWSEGKTWGGTLTENIAQAIARDVMADAMLKIDKIGIDIILTVHDEVILECDLDFKEKDLITLLEQPPVWAEGLPLAAESWSGSRYSKS